MELFAIFMIPRSHWLLRIVIPCSHWLLRIVIPCSHWLCRIVIQHSHWLLGIVIQRSHWLRWITKLFFEKNLCSHWLHGIIVHKFWYWYTIALGWCWWSINVFFALIIVLKPCRGFMCVFFYWLRWIVFPRSHWLHRICKK